VLFFEVMEEWSEEERGKVRKRQRRRRRERVKGEE
jgi:hypothetical protein